MKLRRCTAALAVAALALALTACRDRDIRRADGDDRATTTTERAPAASTSTAPATTAPTTTAAPPCTPAPEYAPGTSTHTLTVAGVERDLLVHVPPAPTADMALVVDFHGAGSDMTQQSIYSGLDPLADEHGFVVATPNGIDAAIRQWRFLGTDDDIAFARAIVAELVAHACVDPDRVVAAGISSGAAMSARLACSASDTFHGFALVAADFYNEALCGAATPRPMLVFHGTDDRVVPYAGGTVNANGAGGRLGAPPAEDAAAGWAAHAGCDPDPTDTTITPHVTRRTWAGCTAPVVFHRIEGGGHTWPGAAIAVDRLGPTTDEISASELIWELLLAPSA